jgi:predicted enzyme related to lactoylglutathione lyase
MGRRDFLCRLEMGEKRHVVNAHGRFVWYVLLTTDIEAAKAFYTKVVGWGTRDASMPGMPYTVFTAGETAVSGVTDLPKHGRGERPGWMGYVSVNDVGATADRIKQLGGAIYVEPQEILNFNRFSVIHNVSRFSVVADPQMAMLALFQWLRPDQEQTVDLRTRGCVGWHELYAADHEKAWDFYSELFGWQKAGALIDEVGKYQLFSAGGQTIGGIDTKPPTVPLPFWLYYFNVGDIDAAVERVKAGSGQILTGPIQVPSGNWIVHCADPQGAIFALTGHSDVGSFEPVDASH